MGVIYSMMQVECTMLPEKNTVDFNCKTKRSNRTEKNERIESWL